MLKTLSQFLHSYCDFSRPVLLALSGGPDSTALLHLLLEFRKNTPLKLQIAHVDHSWREVSRQEALTLQKLACELNIPFHLKTLRPEQLKGNLEAACRLERLQFFKELQKSEGIQAVLLAHHAEDQVETVLKRVFEGAGLTACGGLRPVHTFDGLPLWRPLLPFKKGELLSLTDGVGFQDATNHNPRFLRARLRTQIIPELAGLFGKEISNALTHLGNESQALDDYLNRQIKPYMDSVQKSRLGLFIDLTQKMPVPFELKFLIRKMGEMLGVSISREGVHGVAHLLEQGASDKVIRVGQYVLHVDRRRLFIVNKQSLDWKITCTPAESHGPPLSGWRQVWKGECAIYLPEGEYRVKLAAPQSLYPGNSPIAKWWGSHKVPTFMRRRIPVVWKGDQIVHEFLTGHGLTQLSSETNKWIKLSLNQNELLCYSSINSS